MNNVVGGTAADGNVTAFNGRDGVHVDRQACGNVVGDLLWENSIHDNSGKGIENINGGNTELAPPVVTAVGSASGTACPFCHIEVFSDGSDEGKKFEREPRKPTQMEIGAPNGPVTGPYVTATNTNGSGNTSEFSAPFAVPATPPAQPFTNCDAPPPTPTVTPTPTHTLLQLHGDASLSPQLRPTPTTHTPTPTSTQSLQLGQGDVNCDGQVDLFGLRVLIRYAAGVSDWDNAWQLPGPERSRTSLQNTHGATLTATVSVNALDALYRSRL